MKIKFTKDHSVDTTVNDGAKKKTVKRPSGIKAGKVVDTHNDAWAQKMIDGGFAIEVDGEGTDTGKKKTKA